MTQSVVCARNIAGEKLKKTPLNDVHQKLGARMTAFGGWNMPLYYTNIIEEHMAVRLKAGLFDLSHMGEFDIRGANAEKFVQKIIVNDCARLYDGKILYSPICNENGGIIDDLLVYRFSQDRFLLVVNAADIPADYKWIKKFMIEDVELKDFSGETALVAIQGPESQKIFQQIISMDLDNIAYYHFKTMMWNDFPLVISRTGYTGDDGFEIFINNAGVEFLWDLLSKAGGEFGLKPVGLGARDTLRLEASMPLYGLDITLETNPLEADLSRVVGWMKEDFIGCKELVEKKSSPLEKKLFCFRMEDNAIPRHEYAIIVNGERRGTVTSGTMSPFFKKGIGMGYIKPDGMDIGSKIEIDIRGKSHPAVIVRKPFYSKVKKSAPKNNKAC